MRWFIVLGLLVPIECQAFLFQRAKINAPEYVRFQINGQPTKARYFWDHHRIFRPLVFPLRLSAIGLFGETVNWDIETPDRLRPFNVPIGIVKDPSPNPETLALLPELCPRVRAQEDPPLYDVRQDLLNRVPILQLLDPDGRDGSNSATQTGMDGKNILTIQKVVVRYDYEDSHIVDYEGPHPVTGKPQIIHEGEGGFYANFHFAVVPYQTGLEAMNRQALLHLAQGKLKEIDREDLRPKIRTHSFIPGPYLSKKTTFYAMCEWGDSGQAPLQALEYKDFPIWDWDYTDENKVVLIVWEGDEEEWMVQAQMIHPFYLTDDLVGLFEIDREKTLAPLLLKNQSGDFEITLVTK